MTDGPTSARPDERDAAEMTASARFRRAAETFERVRGLAPDERERALESLCGGDAELVVEVRSLLTFHDQPSETLDNSILRNGIGATIGRYRIADVLGEGGMGTVYLAMQEEPVRREVALKVIKLGMDTRQVVRRFEAERQAIAQMEHPNVARVLDAGATSDGRPYFVMELVRGKPLTNYCDARRLAIPDRLRLFLDVCSAVQHAHQKGVIHRDLKPSNILVTEIDGRAMPKVIDFGVAKALLRPAGDRPVSTLFGDVVGTPDFMSPEQASGNDIDVRSDVYALGVMLYELLAGITPLRARLRAGGQSGPVPPLDELRRIVREMQPIRPASAIQGVRIGDIASERGTDPKALERVLRGDLAWIVLKALALEPARRYATVAAFAEDIERYLRDEPVDARAPSAAYWLAKFARRHTATLAAACLAIVAVLGGLVVALYAFEEARDERDAAVAAQTREAELSRELRAELFQSRVDRGRQRAAQGSLAEARDLLWTAYFENPAAPQALWGLREMLWSRGPFTIFWLGKRDSRAVAFTPDASRIVACCSEGSPAMLDPRTGEVVKFDGPNLDAIDVQTSPDGALAACGDLNGGVTLWDIGEARFVRSLHQGPTGAAYVKFDDARHLVAAGRDGIVRLIDVSDGGPVVELAKAGRPVIQIDRSPQGVIAVGLDDGNALFIQPPDASGVRATTKHRLQDRGLFGLAFDAEGKRIVSSSAAREFQISDATTFEKLVSGRIFPGNIRRVRFWPDGSFLVVPGYWDVMKVDATTGTIGLMTPLLGSSFDIARDGSRVAFGAMGLGQAAVLETDPQAARRRMTPPVGAVVREFNARDGTALAASATDVMALNPMDGRTLWSLPSDRTRLSAWSRDGAHVASIDLERRVLVQSVPDGRLVGFASDAILGEYQTIGFDPRGERLVFETRDFALKSIDLRDGRVTTILEPQPSEILGFAFSPDGATLGVAERSTTNLVIDLATGKRAEFQTDTMATSLGFTADGKTMALGTWRAELVLWDIAARVARVARGHSAFITRVIPHPVDPELLITCADDGSVRIWHRGLARELLAIEPYGPRQPIRTVGWDSTGASFYVVGPEGDLLTYRIADVDRAIEASEEAERARLTLVTSAK
ncbi:MAG: protein kinase [Phycisphaerales bacterium]